MLALLLLLSLQSPAQAGFDLDRYSAAPVVSELAAGNARHAVELLFVDEEDDAYRSQIFLAGPEGWQPLSKGRRDEQQPQWSPDGARLAYLRESRRGKGRMELVIQAPAGEPTLPFDWRGTIEGFAWSPGGERIAFVGTGARERRLTQEREKEPLVIDRLNWFVDGDGPDLGLRTHLYVADLESGKITQLTEGDFDDAEPAWSPDGAMLAFTSCRDAHRFLSYDRDLFLVPAAGGPPRLLTQTRNTESSPAWSPDGNWIAFSGTDRPDRDGSELHLWVMRPDGSGLRNLSRSLDRSIAADDVEEQPLWRDAEHLLCLLEDGGGTTMASFSVEGEVRTWPMGSGVYSQLQQTPDGGIVALFEDTDRPARCVRLALAEGALEVLEEGRTALDWDADLTFGAARRFQVTSFDGEVIEAWFLAPAAAAKVRGTIIDVHGGPNARFDAGFEPEHQLWAAAGFGVLAANPRGSTGYGQAFSDSVAGRYGLEDFQDLMAVLDHALAEGWAAPDRLYLTGYSYGGMMCNWAVTRTDRFRAVVSGAGLSNYLACYGVDDSIITWDQEFGPPWKNLQPYLELSPALHADKVSTPILFLHGADDVRCPASQSIHYFTLLKSRGVDTRLVLYPEESHDLATYPSHWRDYQERLLQWFQDH